MPEISFNPSPVFYVIIGVLAGMIIGWIMGFFDSNNRSSKKIHASESKSEAVIKEANAKIAQAEQQIALATQSTQNPQDDPGLLRLKNNNGRISLEMDGALITDALSSDKKKRLIELITVFRPYLEGGQPSQASPQPIAPTQTPPVPAPVQQEVSQPALKKTDAEKSISSLSIVGQIDTVLQKRLMNSPLARNGIRLQDSLLGGVEVYVGARKFESIDDVPDEAIKVEIRAAIAEWEHKFTPGM